MRIVIVFLGVAASLCTCYFVFQAFRNRPVGRVDVYHKRQLSE